MSFEDPVDRYNRNYYNRGYIRNPNTVEAQRNRKRARNMKEARQRFINRQEFIEHTQENRGGHYLVDGTDTVVEFIRPCSDNAMGYRMRVKCVKTDARFNVDFLDLIPISAMEFLARAMDDEEEKSDDRPSEG